MILPRLIPVLSLDRRQLVKTLQFADPKYIGDPINAVRIFNEKEVDELILLDITASTQNRSPDISFISQIGSEAFMPFAYGGGITSIQQIKAILRAGAEKVSINTSAIHNPSLVKEAVDMFGSQSIIGAIDIKRHSSQPQYHVYLQSGKQDTHKDPIDHAKFLVDLGVGEIFLNSIDHDGKMDGYHLELIQTIASSIPIPLIACGGAGDLEDFGKVVKAGASAAAAGSYFEFCGSRDAILITYPDRDEIQSVFDFSNNKIQ